MQAPAECRCDLSQLQLPPSLERRGVSTCSSSAPWLPYDNLCAPILSRTNRPCGYPLTEMANRPGLDRSLCTASHSGVGKPKKMGLVHGSFDSSPDRHQDVCRLTAELYNTSARRYGLERTAEGKVAGLLESCAQYSGSSAVLRLFARLVGAPASSCGQGVQVIAVHPGASLLSCNRTLCGREPQRGVSSPSVTEKNTRTSLYWQIICVQLPWNSSSVLW